MFIISLVQVGKDSFGNDYIENLKQNDISTGKISSFLKLVFITFFWNLVIRKVKYRIELLDPSPGGQRTFMLSFVHPAWLLLFFIYISPDGNKTVGGYKPSSRRNVSKVGDKRKQVLHSQKIFLRKVIECHSWKWSEKPLMLTTISQERKLKARLVLECPRAHS